MRVAAALLALSLATSAWAAESGRASGAAESQARLRELAVACAAQLDVENDVGFDRVAQRCPTLARALRGSDAVRWFPEGWDADGNEFSRGSLLALVALLDSEAAIAALRPAPELAPLAAALARTTPGDADANGPWARFKGWLRSIFERDDRRHDGWLTRSLRRLEPSDAVMRVVGYVTLGLVVVLAFYIVAAELRAAGVLTGGRRGGRSPGGGAVGAEAVVSWADVERAAPRDRPARLIQLVIDGLVRARRLPPARALTVREIVVEAQLPEETARARLAAIAATAERARFAAVAEEGVALDAVVDEGRALLASLARDPVRT